ncbi:hypothetical protein JH146_0878 [Methanocaldococcus bathoardescens]|uniref:Endonuclease GajA/Old nuclease/RecF-like AAA domain-containing protein n=1 Tax=Methanocaldococcus bathoardescens TaxID=1301915 RepID=A0A076LGZ2_9EURY|nr:AAA family ATPase [Methanocaldococcus bathoardescens]AIJ05723.1 hypothetical protein JH146_0878 [Methanocaldococcus bathoardescens]
MKIMKIEIKNFRSIKEVSIDEISNILILVGKNNSGKSAILNAIDVFWGNRKIKEDDFHKNENKIEIKIQFLIDDTYLEKLYNDSSFGILKIPSNRNDFEILKANTEFESYDFNEFRQLRNGLRGKSLEEIKCNHKEFYDFWMKALKYKWKIEDGTVEIKYEHEKGQDNGKYTLSNEVELKSKTLKTLLPELIYIDDERNFKDEEEGKKSTWTEKIIKNIAIPKIRKSTEKICKECEDRRCEECYNNLKNKKAESLSVYDLEKILKYKMEEEINEISERIAEFFKNYYSSDYSVKLKPEVDIEKAFSTETKIFSQYLGEKPLSNFGAGVRSIYILSLLKAYSELSKNEDAIFILEEPEIYLHPELQKEMGSILFKLSQSHQILFSTHSPLLLRNFSMENIRKVYLNNNYETEVKKETLDNILGDLGYSTVDLINKEFVIIVEGKDDTRRLKEIIKHYYNVDNDKLEKIYFLEAKGCGNIEAYATVKFMGMTHLKDNFVIIRDSDTVPCNKLKERLINKYKSNIDDIDEATLSDKILILPYSAMECYFLDKNVMKKMDVLNSDEEYYGIIRNHIENYREKIIKDWKKYMEKELNPKNRPNKSVEIDEIIEERKLKMFSEISDEKLEDLAKKWIRGHDLYDAFMRELNHGLSEEEYDKRYIQNSTPEVFKDILDFLDKQEYFKNLGFKNR